MTREEINCIPDYIKSGKITEENAINTLSIYILKNKALFGLHHKSDDFCSEVILDFLERAPEILHKFNPEYGKFFTFFYTCVISSYNLRVKHNAIENIIDYHNVSECINNYEIEVEAYSNINFEEFETPKIPYNYKSISYQDFQIACNNDSYHIKKAISKGMNEELKEKLKGLSPKKIQNIIMVLALKSSYYLSDDQIKKISLIFDIDENKIYAIVQKIKDSIEDRENHKHVIEERRNRAYFHHKKYKNQIIWNEVNKDNCEYKNLELMKKYNKNTKSWTQLNHQLEEGKILIRPSSKLIAQVMGISERQVTYYQTTARKLGLDITKV